MSLRDRVSARARGRPVKALGGGLTGFVQPPFWAQEGSSYPFAAGGLPGSETLPEDFEAYAALARGNGIVSACIERRRQVFAQGKLKWQSLQPVNGRPGKIFGTSALGLVERPWVGGTTNDLLGRMEYDASLAGSSFWTRCDDRGRLGRSARAADNIRLVRLRPDWTRRIFDAPSGDLYGADHRTVAYVYLPVPSSGGPRARQPVVFLPEEVCDYTPIFDPVGRGRGISWMTPIIQDILGDQAATEHKLAFFRNGASPQMAVKFDKDLEPELFDLFVQKFNDSHRGSRNAFKTLFLGGGADVVPLTVDLKALDFKVTQGAGETRVAVDAGVPAVLLGISESLGGSSLNDGNFNAAKRLFAHTTIQDLWNKAAPSLAVLLESPGPDAQLIVDGRDIPFLAEDSNDAATIQNQRAQTISVLLTSGWTPDSVQAAMAADDFGLLVHSGRYSVQLLPPAPDTPPATEPPAAGAAPADTTNGVPGNA